MAVSETNRLRYRAVQIARAVKAMLGGFPDVLRARRPRWLWRWLFLADDGRVHRGGEILLADLRSFCGLDRATIFDPDPLVMARREGRREVAVRIFNYLNLDEARVQQLMELDDGLGE